MNSEELEVSLKTEFESYLKNVFADMRQEISQLQEKIEAELEKHRAQLDGVFKEALGRVEQERTIDDAGFRESVVEHLRLARDEGASITAAAIAEAEEMQKQAAASKAGIKELSEAVSDISAKHSQAEILKTLVHHAGLFTPRGALFIIKNEHFVGWRTFGAETGEHNEAAVSDVFLPTTADSLLGEAARSLSAVETSAGTFSDDEALLDKLGFEGAPEKMYALPLVVRGRAVALLYADYGTRGGEVAVQALETLVRVAGLTVELLASSKGASATKRKPSRAFAGSSSSGEGYAAVAPAIEAAPRESAQPEYAAVSPGYTAPVSEPSYKSSFESESFAQQPSFQQEPAAAAEQPQQYAAYDEYQAPPPAQEETPSYSEPAYQQYDAPPVYQPEEAPQQPEAAAAPEAQSAAEERYPAYNEQRWGEASAETVTEINADEYSLDNYSKQFATQDYSTEAKTDDYSQGFSYQPAPATEAESGSGAQDFSAGQPASEYQFDNGQQFQAPQYEQPQAQNFESFSQPQAQGESPQSSYASQPAESYAPPAPAPASEEMYGSYQPVEQPREETPAFAQPQQPPPVAEPVSQPPAQQQQQPPPARSRFSERNVDLPIEVSEDERRLHNDARRFARLLVSEIKLYNEQKVKEGREAGDLYDRLREAIDRSREMYDKRVQPPVAAKFDYFHYELVNTLAEGEEAKLGGDYPGAVV